MLNKDTLVSMQQKQQELAELFLDEADPKKWEEMKRGDAYWERKNCAQTLGLVVRIQTILNLHATQDKLPMGAGGDADLAELAKRAQADADRLIARIKDKA